MCEARNCLPHRREKKSGGLLFEPVDDEVSCRLNVYFAAVEEPILAKKRHQSVKIAIACINDCDFIGVLNSVNHGVPHEKTNSAPTAVRSYISLSDVSLAHSAPTQRKTYEQKGRSVAIPVAEHLLSYSMLRKYGQPLALAETSLMLPPAAVREINGASERGSMDRGLTDLDALLLTVRDQQTKNYIAEAILSYRVGAYRLAIVGTWIAVMYDIISKIRELASTDADGEAIAFIKDFDRHAAVNNVSNLLQIERSLIDTASTKFGFPSAIDAEFLRRLQKDRHLCAHPAFAQNNELFRPLPDSVRSHIVQSVEALLALPPMSGKAIIEAFVTDVKSNAFPRDGDRAIGYVQERYLARMRPNVKRNLATVLIKAQIGANVAQLVNRDESIFDSLTAIERDEPQTFSAEMIPIAADLLDRADESGLVRGLSLLRRFPATVAKLHKTTMDRIHALATAAASDIGVFAAFGFVSNEIDDALTSRFGQLEPGDMATVLATFQDPRLVPPVLLAVKEAGSFRSAEARLANAMLAAPKMSAANFADLIAGVGDNPQVFNANRTPQTLLQLVTFAVDSGLHGTIDWLRLRRSIWYLKEYEPLWSMLATRGVYTAPPGHPLEDDE